VHTEKRKGIVYGYDSKEYQYERLLRGGSGARCQGGVAENTPFTRLVAVRLIHAPVISLTAGQWFTDTTNAYRGYSMRYLTDDRVQVFRDIFMTYELLAYLSVRATQIGMKACEIPVRRSYPKTGKTPTKISFFKGNSELMKILFANLFRKYNVK